MATRDKAAFPRTGHYPDFTGCGTDRDSLRERMDTLTTPEEGMTLREWYAGLAMEGLLAGRPAGFQGTPSSVAGEAVRCADELLRALRGGAS